VPGDAERPGRPGAVRRPRPRRRGPAPLAQARTFADHGVDRFLVASNDHRFARIAAFADLHVLTLHGALVSGRLKAVAATVTVLHHQDGAWRASDPQIDLSAATNPVAPGR